MKIFVILLLTTVLGGCAAYRIVSPQEAVIMCNGNVKKLEAIIGKVECADENGE